MTLILAIALGLPLGLRTFTASHRHACLRVLVCFIQVQLLKLAKLLFEINLHGIRHLLRCR